MTVPHHFIWIYKRDWIKLCVLLQFDFVRLAQAAAEGSAWWMGAPKSREVQHEDVGRTSELELEQPP